MIVFPHAKINLGLRVLGNWSAGKDEATSSVNKHCQTSHNIYAGSDDTDTVSGYHEIESILVPVSLHDILELIPSPDGQTKLFLSGLPVPGEISSNLCLQAYQKIKHEAGRLPPVHIYLHKCIPPGSGLGGGSSDAAYMLLLLNRFFQLNMSHSKLLSLAASLGSDCPFFLQKETMLAKGTGHILKKIFIAELQGKHLAIVVPPLHVSTGWAYKELASAWEKPPPQKPDTSVRLPLSTWQKHIKNHFEQLICKKHPYLLKVRRVLNDNGAVYTSLTGTGSAMYGIFDTPPPRQHLQEILSDSQVFLTSAAIC